MTLDQYTIAFMLTAISGTYRIGEIIGIFFDNNEVNAYKKWMTYSIRYILAIWVSLIIRIPIIMFISNIFTMGLIASIYKDSFRKKVLAVSAGCIISLGVEMFVFLLRGSFYAPAMSVNTHNNIMDLIVIELVGYVVLYTARQYKHLYNIKFIPTNYWTKIIMIPTTSVLMAIIILQETYTSRVEKIICISIILLINIFVFTLYDSLGKMWQEKLHEQLLLQQNNYYEKQFEIMKQSVYKMRAFRHDLKNHLCVLQSLSEAKRNEMLMEYIEQLNKSCELEDVYAKSGNMIIDSIVNFKLQDNVRENIKTKVSISVPENIGIKSFDMTVILGNLIDNALYATNKLKDDKEINITIKYIKGQLIIQIQNTYDGKVLKNKEKLLTLHEDKENHGIGIHNVEATIEQYQGLLEIEYDNKVFEVTAIMYTNVNLSSLQK